MMSYETTITDERSRNRGSLLTMSCKEEETIVNRVQRQTFLTMSRCEGVLFTKRKKYELVPAGLHNRQDI